MLDGKPKTRGVYDGRLGSECARLHRLRDLRGRGLRVFTRSERRRSDVKGQKESSQSDVVRLARLAVGLFASLQLQCTRAGHGEVKIVGDAKGCVHGETQKTAVDVEFDALKATPEAFHRRRVRLTGYLELDFEGTQLFMPSRNCESFEARPLEHSVWLEMAPPPPRYGDICGHRHAIVEGVYDAQGAGQAYSLGIMREINFIRTTGPACSKKSSQLWAAALTCEGPRKTCSPGV
jgi:hypothetical protein